MIRRSLEIRNRLGLHARAAAQLVQAVARFDVDITVIKDAQVVNGKSIIGLMMLAAVQGSSVEVIANGPDEIPALEAIESLFEMRFNED